jgi:hypothetical protein
MFDKSCSKTFESSTLVKVVAINRGPVETSIFILFIKISRYLFNFDRDLVKDRRGSRIPTEPMGKIGSCGICGELRPLR